MNLIAIEFDLKEPIPIILDRYEIQTQFKWIWMWNNKYQVFGIRNNQYKLIFLRINWLKSSV